MGWSRETSFLSSATGSPAVVAHGIENSLVHHTVFITWGTSAGTMNINRHASIGQALTYPTSGAIIYAATAAATTSFVSYATSWTGPGGYISVKALEVASGQAGAEVQGVSVTLLSAT